MKTRVIVGISCALFAIGCLVVIGYGYGAWISLIAAAISALCIYEISDVIGCKNKVLKVISMIYSFLICPYFAFGFDEKISVSTGMIFGIYVLAILILMLKMYSKTRFEHVATLVFCSTAIPVAFSCITRVIELPDEYPEIFHRSDSVFIILMAMFSAWLSDSFALFVGRAFGKHKMSPNISPKKSYEGAIGGVVGTTIFAIAAWAFRYFLHFGNGTIKWWMILICVPIGCVMGMFGDLSASVIKRNYGVKDFGNLLPGHGGAMDRVDSFLFTMPTAYILAEIIVKL